MQTVGCNQAHSDASTKHDSTVILDFGGLYDDSGDQELVNSVVVSQGEVELLAEYFAYGYALCAGSSTYYVNLALGTNNSITLDTNKGAAFAATVNALQSYANSVHHVSAWGANDIESWVGKTY